MLTSVPAIYHALTRHPQFADDRPRRACAGSPTAARRSPPTLVHQIKEAFPSARVGNGFGLTETSSLDHVPARTRRRPSTPTPSASRCRSSTSRIDEPDPETGVGELLVRGPNVVQGYWNKPDATAETFVDGWLHTGDLGRIDDDGLLYIVDRAKDMINRGGENVYSIEVESALAGAPGVGEVAVVGVPDDMMGEKVGAVIVPAGRGLRRRRRCIAHARERIADFKVPQYVAVRDEPLPAQPGRQGAQERSCATRPSGASRCAEGRIRWRRCRPCRAPSTRASWGPSLIHEHVRFRDEAVAENWPGRYDDEAELDAALEAVSARQGARRADDRRPDRDVRRPRRALHGRGRRARPASRSSPAPASTPTTTCRTTSRTATRTQIAELFVEDIEHGHPGHRRARPRSSSAPPTRPGVTEHVEKVHRAGRARERADRRADHGPLAAGRRTPARARSRSSSRRASTRARSRSPTCGDSDDLDYIEGLLDSGVWIGLDRYGLDMFLPMRAAQRDHRRAAAPRPRRPPVPLPGLLRDDRLVPRRRRSRG